MILLWDNYETWSEEAEGSKYRHVGYCGMVSEHGSAPEPGDWKKIDIYFQDPQSWSNDTRFEYSAVVVLSKYL